MVFKIQYLIFSLNFLWSSSFNKIDILFFFRLWTNWKQTISACATRTAPSSEWYQNCLNRVSLWCRVVPPPSPQDPRPQPTLASSRCTIQAAAASAIIRTWAAAQRIIRAGAAVIGGPRRRRIPATTAGITPAAAIKVEEATTILCMVEVVATWLACNNNNTTTSSSHSTTTIINNNNKEIQTWDHGHNKTINEIIRRKFFKYLFFGLVIIDTYYYNECL